MDKDQFSGEDRQVQYEEVLSFLYDNPIKESLQREDGSSSVWMHRSVEREKQRTALREAEDRYRHELMDEEEHQLLGDWIRRLRRELGLV